MRLELISRFIVCLKSFVVVFKMNEGLGILGGHHYQDGEDRPVTTFETFSN
jgi:hypothetical protein